MDEKYTRIRKVLGRCLQRPHLVSLLALLVNSSITDLSTLRKLVPTRFKYIKKQFEILSREGLLSVNDEGKILWILPPEELSKIIEVKLFVRNKLIGRMALGGETIWIVSWFRKRYVRSIVVKENEVEKIRDCIKQVQTTNIHFLSEVSGLERSKVKGAVEVLKITWGSNLRKYGLG
ncbi:MAG: hypothetical protein J7L38_06165 [Thermoproteales archaeon]|nr:hypothetical protein [Thermoproteales archaeon]